jgi:hypothetical protein
VLWLLSSGWDLSTLKDIVKDSLNAYFVQMTQKDNDDDEDMSQEEEGGGAEDVQPVKSKSMNGYTVNDCGIKQGIS